MYLEKIHLSWIGPLGQEFSAEPLLRKGARVTLYVGECRGQWHVYIHLKPMCYVNCSLAPKFCSSILSTYITELHLTLSLQSYLEKRTYLKKLNCMAACTHRYIFYAIL